VERVTYKWALEESVIAVKFSHKMLTVNFQNRHEKIKGVYIPTPTLYLYLTHYVPICAID